MEWYKKVTEVLKKNTNGKYQCPGCGKIFTPQGITKHVKACAQGWCTTNNIK